MKIKVLILGLLIGCLAFESCSNKAGLQNKKAAETLENRNMDMDNTMTAEDSTQGNDKNKSDSDSKKIKDWNEEAGGDYELPISVEEQEELKKEAMSAAESYQKIYDNLDRPDNDDITIPEETLEEIVKKISSAGFIVVSDYTNMEHADNFRGFYSNALSGDTAEAKVIAVNTNAGFTLESFKSENKVMTVTLVNTDWNEEREPIVTSMVKYQLNWWRLTDKGYFLMDMIISDIAEADGHMAFRVEPIKDEYRQYCEKYIEPVGYQGNNLFLTDWDSEHLEKVNFNDLFEYIYNLDSGKIAGEKYSNFLVPEKDFENVMLKYFPVTQEKLKQLAVYEEHEKSYKWIPYFAPQSVPVPEVVDYKENEDGTFTLVVDAVWVDHETDCAFTHEVTIKPEEDGGFLYLSNVIRENEDNIFPEYTPRAGKEKSE